MKRHIAIVQEDTPQGDVLLAVILDAESYSEAIDRFKKLYPDHFVHKSNYGYAAQNLQSSDNLLHVYLDDERLRPAHFDYLVRHVETAIELLKTGLVEFISLDNDLGSGYEEGYKVADWLEEEIISGRLPFVDFIPHTANDVAFQKIMQARRNVFKATGK